MRRAAQVSELKLYALGRLGDPDLNPQRVAQANYVSVRQVHRLFAGGGLSFGAWIREERLRRCRNYLADPLIAQLTISEIAGQWGYRSAAHFTRAFAARFGMTPRAFRQAERSAHAVSRATCRESPDRSWQVPRR